MPTVRCGLNPSKPASLRDAKRAKERKRDYDAQARHSSTQTIRKRAGLRKGGVRGECFEVPERRLSYLHARSVRHRSP